MESTTPTSAPPGRQIRNRSRSASHHGRTTPSRPTTPLRDRAPSRTSLRASTTTPTHSSSHQSNGHPLDILEPAFAEFSDSMADLEANMMHLQLLQESLNRFNENFGAFLYGLNMNAFTVDFTEAPGVESFKRAKDMTERQKMQDTEGRGTFGFAGAASGTKTGLGGGLGRGDVDATFLYARLLSSALRIIADNLDFLAPLIPLSWKIRLHQGPLLRTEQR